MKKALIIPTAVASSIVANAGKADQPLTPEEQTMLDKGATMEMYSPKEHNTGK